MSKINSHYLHIFFYKHVISLVFVLSANSWSVIVRVKWSVRSLLLTPRVPAMLVLFPDHVFCTQSSFIDDSF